jgi:glycosyltransferase involved in cell wall biosynthesis
VLPHNGNIVGRHGSACFARPCGRRSPHVALLTAFDRGASALNELFCQATVFVQTSVHEGFALPPLEAMATGAAVVCTDAHGNRDFCVDGVNCLMPEADAGAVSAALARLLADPELRVRLGRAGIETAREYEWERRIDALEAFFERVAASRRIALAGELAALLGK